MPDPNDKVVQVNGHGKSAAELATALSAVFDEAAQEGKPVAYLFARDDHYFFAIGYAV